jgi:hypothetical protein
MGNYEIDMERPTPAEEEQFAKWINAHRKAVKAVVADLEAEFADRQLKFTVPFAGSIPVQAWGYMDGYRFYFRFRGDIGALRLGIANPQHYVEINNLKNEREVRQLAELEDGLKSGNLDKMEYDKKLQFFTRFMKTEKEESPEFDDPQFYPTHIKKQSVIPDYTGERYEGALTPAQMSDIFTKLVKTLEDCDVKF